MKRLAIAAVGLALVVGIIVGAMVGNLFGASAQHTATAASPVSALSVGASLGAALSTATASAPVAGVTGGAQLTAAVATATATAPSATATGGGASLAASVATATASTLPATFQGATTGTLDLLVDASSDDATELYSGGGPMTLDGTNMGVHYNPGDLTDRWVAVRFHSGSFPAKGSTVTVAYITPYVSKAYGDDANLDIYAQDAESPTTFTTTAGDISGRTRTTHTVPWIADNLGGGWHNSPSLVSIIQELVTDHDCTAIAFILKGKHDVDKSFYIATWDYSTHTLGAKLHLEWTEPYAVGGIAELPPLASAPGAGASGMGGTTYAVLAGAAAGVLAFAVLATLTVKRRGVR